VSSRVLPILRARTRSVHDRLESRLKLLDAGLTRDRYRAVLTSFYSLYAPIEQRLAQHGTAALPDWRDRCKQHLLASDLRAMGTTALPPTAPAAALPRLDTPARALGCWYVLEGATLGGRTIRRHLANVLDVPLAFFDSYGSAVPRKWHSFTTTLEARVAAGADPDEVVDGAVATFTAFEGWLVGAPRGCR
jgi:heme oxygenase (biliverdin-IX-beta and delta-forming)